MCPSGHPRAQIRRRRLRPPLAAGVRSMAMNRIYLPSNASRARLRDAERARRNRVEIVRELPRGRVSRGDLWKWVLFRAPVLLAPIVGLNPFVKAAAAAVGPTGAPPSPLSGALAFTQP